ncbi:MAG: hypothetical protein AB1798_15125 [Spirochaetota bacterium]
MKKVWLLLLLVFILTGLGFAQNTPKDPNFGIGIELASTFFLISAAPSFIVSFPLALLSSNFTVKPFIGFTYIIPALDEISGVYLPLGCDFMVNKYRLGISLKHYFAVPGILKEGGIVGSIKGMLLLLDKEKYSFIFTYEFGISYFWNTYPNTDANYYVPMYLLFINPAIVFRINL